MLNLTAALMNQGSGIALAVVSALLVARVATNVQAQELPPYLVTLAALTIAKAAFTWLDMWFAHNVAYGMLAWLRSSAYDALEPLAPAYTLKHRSGDIVSMVTADVETIELFFAHTLVPLLVMLLVPTVLLMALAVVAWPLAVILLPFLLLVASLPLLPLALQFVAHHVIRNRGTICGSLAHADPAAELCAALLVLGGQVVARSTGGERVIAASELFCGPFETALAPDELITEAWLPAHEAGEVTVLEESRRHGDFAMAGVARFRDRVALFGVAGTPVLADPDDPTRDLQPSGDLESSPDFKLHLVQVLVARAFGRTP